jgi:hypothetical protein
MKPRSLVAALCVVLSAGCGTPATVEEQAEQVGSIAAEGALLAHDASEGDTTRTFTRVHARELAKKADELSGSIRRPDLGRLARRVALELRALASAPGHERQAALLEHSLDQAAKRAEAIGKAAS